MRGYPPFFLQTSVAVTAIQLVEICPIYIHSILKLAPVLSQKSRKMHLVPTFCSSTAKTRTVTPIFYFMILIRTVLPFDEKKIGTNVCSVFWQFY